MNMFIIIFSVLGTIIFNLPSSCYGISVAEGGKVNCERWSNVQEHDKIELNGRLRRNTGLTPRSYGGRPGYARRHNIEFSFARRVKNPRCINKPYILTNLQFLLLPFVGILQRCFGCRSRWRIGEL
ncbi:hypothetical protein NQ317_006207 [Molorchus minor]|uniref:Uncharacterized protein n=1 Tax=Molorchus minor TaxID=1323400 RepID=A0ABQ9ITH6_9CUCU|nr:hypothetical protein NQ317_006207 [Molorchus minor]